MLVTKSTGSWYTVLDRATGESFRARLRGTLRLAAGKSTNPVAVGDEVDIEDARSGDYVIAAIHPRRNFLVRRSTNLSRQTHIIAANIDRLYLVVTAREPVTNPEFIDRVLVTAEAYNVPATLIINKIDIDAGDELEEIYTAAGYPIIKVSTVTGEGIDAVRAELSDKVSLLTGNSGVGKSSIINAIDPAMGARTGRISTSHHKGMHTTTFSEIFTLSSGGYIIDTPGIKGFGLVDFEKGELQHYFPEMMAAAPDCQYYNCTHTHEPGCAVEGRIHPARYESYLKMLDDDGKHRE